MTHKVGVDGLTQLRAMNVKFTHFVYSKDRHRVAKRVLQIVTATTRRAFATESDPVTGITWKLRKSSKRQYRLGARSRGGFQRLESFTHPLLDLTGTMKESALWSGVDLFVTKQSFGITISDTTGYGYKHQFGYATEHIPRRRFVGLSSADISEIVGVLGEDSVLL